MPLGDGVQWDETNPQQSTLANTIDSYDRDLRVGVRLRMANEHTWPSSQTGTAQAGQHIFMTLQSQTSTPSFTGSQSGVIYQKTDQNLYFNNGSDIQITNTGNLNNAPFIYNYSTGTSVGTSVSGPKITFGSVFVSSTVTIVGLPFLNNTSYTVVAVVATATNNPVYVYNLSTTGFSVAPNVGNVPINWIAIGV